MGKKKNGRTTFWRNGWQTIRPTNWFQRFLMGLNTISLLLLFGAALSVYVSPAQWPFTAILALGFPIFLCGTLLTMLLTLVTSPRLIWFPLLGLLVCTPAIRTYYPINFSHPKVEKGDLRVVSWNVYGFWGDDLNDECVVNGEVKTYNPTARHLRKLRPDLICLQEAYGDYQSFIEPYVTAELKDFLPHHMHNTFDGSVLLCYSRYPIVKTQRLYMQNANGSMAYWIEKSPGDTLLVINNHLSTMGLNSTDRDEFKAAVEHPEENFNHYTLRNILRKLTSATAKRAIMADSIAAFIAQHRQYPMIVCGDFNDTPISYARHRISEGLIDAYRSCATGLGRSFHRDAIVVRIDHIFCSSDFQPIYCTIDRSTERSDHYPIFGILRYHPHQNKK